MTGYLQVVAVEVALWRLAGDFVSVMRLDDTVEEVAEQDVGLSVTSHTAHRGRTAPITFVHTQTYTCNPTRSDTLFVEFSYTLFRKIK